MSRFQWRLCDMPLHGSQFCREVLATLTQHCEGCSIAGCRIPANVVICLNEARQVRAWRFRSLRFWRFRSVRLWRFCSVRLWRFCSLRSGAFAVSDLALSQPRLWRFRSLRLGRFRSSALALLQLWLGRFRSLRLGSDLMAWRIVRPRVTDFLA